MKLRHALGLSLLAILFVGCNTTPTEVPVVEEPSTETPTENTFVSEDLGFTMTFPATWETTSALKDTTWAFGTSKTLYVMDKDGVDIFAVTRFTKAQWTDVQKEEGPKPTVIGEEGDFVWAYDQTQDPSSVQAYVDALPEVLKTFETN